MSVDFVEILRAGTVRPPSTQDLLQGRIDVYAGDESDDPIVMNDVHHRPVGEQRHRQPADDIDQVLEGDERRQPFRDAGEERQRIPLSDQRTLVRVLRLFAPGDLETQLFVRPFERDGALFDAFFELGMGGAQCLFAETQRPLGRDALGDIAGVTEYVGPSGPCDRTLW